MSLAATFLSLLLAPPPAPPQPTAPLPAFSRFPAAVSHHPLHPPNIRTAGQRRFRTVLTQAVTRGYGVVEGGTEHERPGPNFAGHFLLVQWSCGLDCTEAAVIDTLDGTILALPTLPGRPNPPSFVVETGSGDLRNLQFRVTSRLLVIPNAPDRMAYTYILNGHTWNHLSRYPIPEPPPNPEPSALIHRQSRYDATR